MTTAKRCQGCQTKRDRCLTYIGHKNKPFHQLFRDRFCPCAECIVKPTCQDPKYSQLSYAGYRPTPHKCKRMYEGVTEYWEYLSEKGIRESRIRRKRRNKARQK